MSKASQNDNSRELLLKAGKVLFAKNGFDGTTVRDIANFSGVNLSMVSYHFDGKEGLYRACINEYGQKRLQFAQGMFDSAKTSEEFQARLKIIISAIVNAQYQEPELTKILYREVEAGLPVAKDVFEQTFLKMTEGLIGFFKSAQKSGIFRKDIDPHAAAVFIHGTIGHFTRVDTINKIYFQRTISDPRQREAIVDNLFRFLCEGGLVRSDRA